MVLNTALVFVPPEGSLIRIMPRRPKQPSSNSVHRIPREWFLEHQKTFGFEHPTDLAKRLGEIVRHMVQRGAGRRTVEGSISEWKTTNVGQHRIRIA